MVDNVKCEIEGIVCALEQIVDIIKNDASSKDCYILTDCQSALDVVVNQKDAHLRIDTFRKIWKHVKTIRNLRHNM